MRRAVCWVVSMAVGLMGLAAQPARADRMPTDCNKNGAVLNVERSQAEVKNGDAIKYYLTVGNDAAGSCNVTGATIDPVLPAPDGNQTGRRGRGGPGPG